MGERRARGVSNSDPCPHGVGDAALSALIDDYWACVPLKVHLSRRKNSWVNRIRRARRRSYRNSDEQRRTARRSRFPRFLRQTSPPGRENARRLPACRMVRRTHFPRARKFVFFALPSLEDFERSVLGHGQVGWQTPAGRIILGTILPLGDGFRRCVHQTCVRHRD